MRPLADAGAQNRWNTPTYLLAVDGIVYGVGRDIRAFHADDLTHPLWTFPPPATSQLDDDEAEAITAAEKAIHLVDPES